MFLGILLASFAQTSSAADQDLISAACIPVGQVERGIVQSLNLRCPTDVPDALSLQNYASNVAGQMGMPVDLTVLTSNPAEEVEFVFQDGTWILPEPTPFTQSPPDFPRRAAMNSRVGRCDMRADISDAGRAEDIVVVCAAFRTNGRPVRGGDVFEESALEAFQSWRYFAPLDQDARCVTSSLTFSLGRGDSDHLAWRDEPVDGAPTCPDPSTAPTEAVSP